MKKLLIISFIALLTINANSQVRWPFGAANSITPTSALTIDIGSSLTRGINYVDLNTDTTLTLSATSIDTEVKTGDLIIIEATESSTEADTINYSTGFTGLYDPLPSGKTRIITFIYNGTAFKKVSSTQID